MFFSVGGDGAATGFAHALLAPALLRGEINGRQVIVNATTDYPFDGAIRYDVLTDSAFTLYVRIPSWAGPATSARLDGATLPSAPANGTFYAVVLSAGAHVVDVALDVTVRAVERFNGAVAIYRGPLLFAAAFGERWTELRHYPDPKNSSDDSWAINSFNVSDWEIDPTREWRHAIQIDLSDPAASLNFSKFQISDFPFASPPIIATARGRKIEWGVDKNSAAAPPQSPVASTAEEEEIPLVPFGCTRLRVAELPRLPSDGGRSLP